MNAPAARQVARSPRRFGIAGVCGGLFVIIAGMLWASLGTEHAPAMLVAGPVCLLFLLVAGLRALLSKVEWDADGGIYAGLLKTQPWRWANVKRIGRQTTYAVGSTGSTPEVGLRDGRRLVLVALADPRHPDAEDALIAGLTKAHEAYRRDHPSATDLLLAELRDTADTPDVSASDSERAASGE